MVNTYINNKRTGWGGKKKKSKYIKENLFSETKREKTAPCVLELYPSLPPGIL